MDYVVCNIPEVLEYKLPENILNKNVGISNSSSSSG
jgi:hypothetical protein